MNKENSRVKTKNDGTDPKKNDGTSVEVESTTRTCFLMLTNNWGGKLTDVVLTHTMGDHNDHIAMPIMDDGTSSLKIQINFETGAFASYDYWNISFTDSNNQVWNTPNNDRCNISSEDAGQTVNCIVTNANLYVDTPVSSGCNFEITKN